MRSPTGAATKAVKAVPAGSFVHTSHLPGSAAAAASAVKRAHKSGELVKVRRGLYFKGAKTRYGLTRPSAEAVALEVLGRAGVGPTGFSAARAFGLTTQVPARPALVVTGTVPTSLTGVRVSKRNNLRRLALRPLEIAVLELLRGDWETTVDDGWSAMSTAVGNAVAGGKLRWRELSDAAKGERSPALRKNLIRLTEDLQASGMLA
ncbi:hypothetical protein GCM10011591_28440 [Nocardia camponoti]|uniref:Type IV toxin-antitoxin system AbiEi family antitoxin domain-containing protein n=2 Tax=Nocardia camponoti TaxID=1616106 RepID=A0A917QK55_9NOCA|nr:hypothetical protein GCM10011591_28440 [Nocardia camponoti]